MAKIWKSSESWLNFFCNLRWRWLFRKFSDVRNQWKWMFSWEILQIASLSIIFAKLFKLLGLRKAVVTYLLRLFILDRQIHCALMCHPNFSVAYFSSDIRWRVGRHYVFNSSFLFHRSGKRFSNEAILFHAFLAITLCSNIMIRCVAWFLTICEQHSNWILLTNKSSVNGRGPSLLSAFDLSVSANLMKTKQHVSWLLLSSLHVCPQLAFNTSKYEI